MIIFIQEEGLCKMDKGFFEVIASIGISGAMVVLMFYLWLKKVIVTNIVKPELSPIEVELKEVQ